MRIFLIGFMGAGKSTVSALLAKRLGISFIDMDTYIEETQNKEIHRIFIGEGEANFRKIEKSCLQQLLEKDNYVLACGGGTPCFSDNMHLMLSAGKVIYLNADSEIMYQRVAGTDHKRPMLSNKKDFIALNDQRKSIYNLANITVNANALPEEIAIEIIQRINE